METRITSESIWQIYDHLGNNASPTDANYHIGRLKWEKSVAKVPGAKDFWTEKSYTFQNNLLKTEKVRANGSNWRTSTYAYDAFGNVTSKSIAIVGKPARTESFTYPNGRDMRTHTNVLGLTTTLARVYNACPS